MGAYCSVQNDTRDIMYIKFGANIAAIQWAAVAAAILATAATLGAAGPMVAGGIAATSVGLAIAKNKFDEELRRDGYTAVQPGATYTSDKLTLSLLMQANIVLVGDRGTKSGTLECWTGAEDGACKEYRASMAKFDFRPF
jgi:hypothetical protein